MWPCHLSRTKTLECFKIKNHKRLKTCHAVFGMMWATQQQLIQMIMCFPRFPVGMWMSKHWQYYNILVLPAPRHQGAPESNSAYGPKLTWAGVILNVIGCLFQIWSHEWSKVWPNTFWECVWMVACLSSLTWLSLIGLWGRERVHTCCTLSNQCATG